MWHGTSESVALKIIRGGFGNASATDNGFFGRGIYFTSSMEYAADYAVYTGGSDRFVLVLALVSPGNSLPVTESPEGDSTKNYYGKAGEKGYQSHYTTVKYQGWESKTPVNKDSIPTWNDDLAKGKIVDELVLFEGAQVLPLFLVYFDPRNADFKEVQQGDEQLEQLLQQDSKKMPEDEIEKLVSDFVEVSSHLRFDSQQAPAEVSGIPSLNSLCSGNLFLFTFSLFIYLLMFLLQTPRRRRGGEKSSAGSRPRGN